MHQSTHTTTRQILQRTIRIRHSSLYRIIRQNFKLKCLKKRRAQEHIVTNCALRRTRARKLIRSFPAFAVDFIFFTDENILTVEPPVNLQNGRVNDVPKMTK